MKTILVPLDGSPVAAEALPHAEALARRQDAEILLLGVVETGPTEAASRYLEEVESRCRERGVAVRRMVVSGHASDQILRRASEEPAGMLVMRSHGRRGLSRLWLGSVTDRVVREAPCPVLVVRGPVAAEPCYRNILVPLDGTASSERALPLAASLVQAEGGCLKLVRVLDPPVPFYRDQPPLDWSPTLSAELQSDCQAYLEERARELTGLSVEVGVRRGSPAEQILEAAAEEDLVVLGSHGRSWLERALLGSVASRVVHHASCPVLLVPAGASQVEAANNSSKMEVAL